MMRLCIALILMLALYQVESSKKPKVFGNLHKPSSLPCLQTCSGLLTWTMFKRQDDVLANCTRDSCWSKAGFSLNHEQFLRGDSALTVLRADYNLRGLYVAKCDSETVCEVVFILSPQEMSRNITPGEPIDVHIPFTDLVEVNFTASDAAHPSNLQICTMDNKKIKCIPNYKERSSLLNTLQIQNGNFSDSGNFTVRDLVNNEILVNLQICVKEDKTCPDSNQERSLPAWASALIAVLVILLILSVLAIAYLLKENQKFRKGPAHSTHQMTENSNGHQQNGVNGRARPNPDENSVHTPLT